VTEPGREFEALPLRLEPEINELEESLNEVATASRTVLCGAQNIVGVAPGRGMSHDDGLQVATEGRGALRRRGATLAMAVLVAGIVVTAGAHAVTKPLWYDEVATVIVSRLPGIPAIVESLRSGADNNPPLFYVVSKFSRALMPDDHLGYRLPSILGLVLVVLSLYGVLSKRVCRTSALAGACYVLCTPLAPYAYEARPYALLAGLIATAILAWQRLDSSRWYALLLGFCLALAVSVHYYAIFVWPVLGAAEALVWWLRRRARWEVWAALVLGAGPLLLYADLLNGVHHYYRANFWAPAHLSMIFTAHGGLLALSGYLGFGVAFCATVVFVCWARREVTHGTGQHHLVEESALAFLLLWFPAIAVVASKVAQTAMTERYLLPTVLGAALIVGYVCSRVPIAVRRAVLASILIAYGLTEVDAAAFGRLAQPPREATIQPLQLVLREYARADEPIVISSGLRFLPAAYYATPDIRRRVWALTDPGAAVAFAGSDSVDQALAILRHYYPMQVEEYATFATRHPVFLLVCDGRRFDYWAARLAKDGSELTLLAAFADSRLYRVVARTPQRGTPVQGANARW